MAHQETVKIINVKRSTENIKVEQTIFKTLWLKKEAKLRDDGWLPANDIKEVIYEKIEDGKEIDTIEVVEESVKEVVVDTPTTKTYSEMSLEELKRACDEKEINYHHASRSKKLISLLEA